MKPLHIILIIFGSIMIIAIAGVGYIGAASPETFVYTKNDLPKSYLKEMKELELIEEGEQVQFMYSDALLDIKGGIYAITDKHLVFYNKEWSQPKYIIGFDEIDYLNVEYNDSFLEDSYITIETFNGIQIVFPVSSEKNRDHEFFDYLSTKIEASKN